MSEPASWAREMHQEWRQATEKCGQLENVYSLLLTRLREGTTLFDSNEAEKLEGLLQLLQQLTVNPVQEGPSASKHGLSPHFWKFFQSIFENSTESPQPQINNIIVQITNRFNTLLSLIKQEMTRHTELMLALDAFLQAKVQSVRAEENHNVTYHVGALWMRLESIAERIEQVVEEQDRLKRNQEQMKDNLDDLHGILQSLNDTANKNVDRKPHINTSNYSSERIEAALSQLEEIVYHMQNGSLEPNSLPSSHPAARALKPVLSDFRYFVFEEIFRGSREAIGERLRIYLPYFQNAPEPVLEIGSGRGEFLEWMNTLGKKAYGVDANSYEVELLKKKGWNVYCEDALKHLEKLPEASVGGVFCAQVVEHLSPEYVFQIISQLYRAMKPNAPVVIETLNITSMFSFHHLYFKDPTHVFPVHPETLVFFLRYCGFRDVHVKFVTPAPDIIQLPLIPADTLSEPLQSYLNQLVVRLNELIFNSLEYFVTGHK